MISKQKLPLVTDVTDVSFTFTRKKVSPPPFKGSLITFTFINVSKVRVTSVTKYYNYLYINCLCVTLI